MRNRLSLAIILCMMLFAIGFKSIRSDAVATDMTLNHLNVMLEAAESWLEDEPLIVLQHVGTYAPYASMTDFTQHIDGLLTEYKKKKADFGLPADASATALPALRPTLSEHQATIQYHASYTTGNDVEVSLSLIGSAIPEDDSDWMGASQLFIRIEGRDWIDLSEEQKIWQDIIQTRKSHSSHKVHYSNTLSPEPWHILLRGLTSQFARSDQIQFQRTLIQDLKATLLDEYLDANTVSLSLNSPKMRQNAMMMKRNKNVMNLQIMLHHDSETAQQELIIGYPGIGSLN